MCGTVQALAILWYLNNSNDDWKNSGIKDEDIKEVDFSPEEPREALGRVRYGFSTRRRHMLENDFGSLFGVFWPETLKKIPGIMFRL